MDFFIQKSIGLFFSCLCLVTAVCLKRKVKLALHPSCIYSFCWFIFTFVPQIVLFKYIFSPWSILYIWVSCIAFSSSVFLFSWKFPIERFRSTCEDRFLFIDVLSGFCYRFFMLLLATSGCFFNFYLLIINGYSLSEILANPLYTAGSFAMARGGAGIEYGLIGALGVACTYASACLGGFLSARGNLGVLDRVYVILALLPACVAVVLQSSKLIFLLSALFFVSARVLTNFFKLKFSIISLSTISRYLPLAFICGGLAIASFLSRDHFRRIDSTVEVMARLQYDISSYLLGQVYAFSDFFSAWVGLDAEAKYVVDEYTLGKYSFTAILDILGFDTQLPPGTYLETGKIAGVLETNIFTFFRGLIQDFGIIGSFFILFSIGFILNFSFYRMLWNCKIVFYQIIFICGVVFIGMSYLISVFMARYMYAVGVSLLVVLSLCRLFRNLFRRSRYVS